MKRIIMLFLILTLVCSLFTLSAFAEGADSAQTDTDTAQEAENSAKTNESEIYDKIIAYITNGEIWAKIGVVAVSVLALILAIKKSLAKVHDALRVLRDFIAGKATKEDTEAAISSAMETVRSEYTAHTAALTAQYEDLCKRNNDLEAILSLVALQLVKSPNARTEIMALISKSKAHSGNVAEVVEAIEAEIERADELTKDETPALDAIKAEMKLG